MKNKTIPYILAMTTGVLLAAGASRADGKKEEKKSPAKPNAALTEEAIQALEKSGMSPEMLKQVKKAMEKGESGPVSVSTMVIGPDGKVISQSSSSGGKVNLKEVKTDGKSSGVSISTKVIGPDGKVISHSGGKGVSVDSSKDGKQSMTIDLGKLISEATASAGSSKNSVSSSISGKVVIVDEDGNVQTQSIGDQLGTEALEKALGEALNSIDIKMLNSDDLKNQAQVFGFGQAMIADEDVADRLSDIEKELKEQRKLLEKILKKL
ncbi:MAG: hypothetical protein P1U85_15445 [Verrucomicrobiales bacterium]|nr:hypothetical protein [Verrucomicrobiales bacterium]